MAEALSFTKQKADRRVQLKMPKLVVEQIDKLFPEVDRSTFITQLALEAILRKLRFPEPEIDELVSQEQAGLDRMWEYLQEQENV